MARSAPSRPARDTPGVRPAVFLDRDDTLIRRRGGLPTGDLGDPADVEAIPGAREALARLKRAGFTLVVATNQGGVARGRYTLADVDRVHARVNELMGGVIDAFRACPWHPEGTVPEFTREHEWRKPRPGMLLDAAEKMGLDLSRSWMIGDAERDALAGKGAGCRTILVGDGSAFRVYHPGADSGAAVADHHVMTMGEAADIVLRASGARAEELPGESARVLVVLPSWIGDAVMATPALEMLRRARPGALIGGLARGGVDEVLSGSGLIDQFHRGASGGIMAPKVSAQRVRMGRYGSAALLTNSFSTALATRLAGIPRRVGYERDGRSMLLTDRLSAPRRKDVEPFRRAKEKLGDWAPVSACDYYVRLMRFFLADESIEPGTMQLGVTTEQKNAARGVLERTGVRAGEAYAVLNPGGNNPAKRWPPERFADVAKRLVEKHGLRVLVNGSPAEAEVTGAVVEMSGAGAVDLARCGGSIGALKAIVRDARILVTNDTGPRHIAAAFGTPVVALFGPTDPRWTDISNYLPARRDGKRGDVERVIVADPTLPEELVADDHPERCRVERIETSSVIDAVDELLD